MRRRTPPEIVISGRIVMQKPGKRSPSDAGKSKRPSSSDLRRMTSLGIYLFSVGLSLGSAASLRRGYQDSWVLEGLVPQVIFTIVAFTIYVQNEQKSQYIALAASLFTLSLRLVPALKYSHSYGLAIDQGVHLANLTSLVKTGFPEPGNIYTDEPGIYIILAALRIFKGPYADDLIRFGPPLILSLYPLFIYTLSKQIKFTEEVSRYITLASILVIDPYFLTFQGSTFGSLLLTLLSIAIISREISRITPKLSWSIYAILILVALAVSHAITSIIACLLFFLVGLIINIASLSKLKKHTNQERLGYAIRSSGILGLVIVLSWWMYRSGLVFNVIVQKGSELISNWSNPTRPPIPSKFFNLSLLDQLKVVMLHHIDFLLLAALSILGIWTIWKGSRWQQTRKSYSFHLILIIEGLLTTFLIAQMVLRIGQIEYSRLISYAIALTPFLIGPAFVQFSRSLKRKANKQLTQVVLGVSLSILIAISLIQAFPYQPLLPKSAIIKEELGVSEPLLYMHSVLSNQQVCMLDFVNTHRTSTDKLGADVVTHNSAVGQWGINLTREIGMERSVPTRSLEDGKWITLMTHHPGIAGSLFEQAEFRTLTLIDPLQYPLNYSVLYDNGGAFVISR
jgi:hypothetical protein